MKNYYKISMVVLIMSGLSACSVKTTASKSAVSSSTSGSTANTNPGTTTCTTTGSTTTCTTIGTGTTTGTSVSGCDGVSRNGASRCYYKNIPTVLASGGTYGQTWWSSTNFISTTGNSPGQFSTDASFNVRIIPRTPTANSTSTFGKTCSPYRMYATKLKVQLMIHKSGVSVGEVATLTAPINTASNVWHFTVPSGTTDPLVLEVINVSSDSRCTGFYGSNPSSCTSNPYLDIPINTAGPTECVAFDIQYSTDETYDLPGSSAN